MTTNRRVTKLFLRVQRSLNKLISIYIYIGFFCPLGVVLTVVIVLSSAMIPFRSFFHRSETERLAA